jgi:hypothetical protein
MAKKNKFNKTDWFDGKIKPVRVGVYEQGTEQYGQLSNKKHITGGVFSYWDGKVWRGMETNIKYLYKDNIKCVFQEEPWRGLKSKS